MPPRPVISKSWFKFKCLLCASCLCGERVIFLFQYRLETFSESRLSEWVFEPFTSK